MRGDSPHHARLRLVFYTNIFFEKKNKHECPKDVVKFKKCHSKWYHKICNKTFSYRFIVAAILDEKSNIFLCKSTPVYLLKRL